MSSTNYEGWHNKATWNVSLYLNNEEGIYRSAVSFMESEAGKKSRSPYATFIRRSGMEDERTPDGFKWLSTRLCYRELNEMMKELV